MIDRTVRVELRQPGENHPRAIMSPAAYATEQGIGPGVFVALLNGEQVLSESSVRDFIHSLEEVLDVARNGLNDASNPEPYQG